MKFTPLLALAALLIAGCDHNRDNNDTFGTRTRSSTDRYNTSGNYGPNRTYENNRNYNENGTYNRGASDTSGRYDSNSTSNDSDGGYNDGTRIGTSGSGGASLNDVDRNFVNEAAAAGTFEVQSAQIAIQKSFPDRSAAQMIIDDHQRANQQLQELARNKGISVPQQTSSRYQDKLDKLRNFSRDDFAQQFRNAQIQAHQDAIALFQREINQGQDPDLRNFAQQTLPKLRMHLEMMQKQSGSDRNDDMNRYPSRSGSDGN